MTELLDTFQIAYHRLTRAVTLEGAMKQLMSPSVVSRALQKVHRTGDLLEYIAEDEALDRHILLEEVAERLGLGWIKDLRLPTVELIRETGYEAQFLRSILALPQYSNTAPSGWAIVVADPETVSVREYEARGIEVVIALARDIEQVWAVHERLTVRNGGKEISTGQILAIMEQLARDAASCGAREVFVGHPESSRYEFLAGDKRYSGQIHPGVYNGLLMRFTDGTRFEHQCDSADLKKLSFALTKNFKNPVVYLSWESRGERVEAQESQCGPVTGDECTDEQEAGENDISRIERDDCDLEELGRIEPKVMLIDDDTRFVKIVREILERKGYLVSSHFDGESALRFLENDESPPDVVICDVHMPKVDGALFLKRMRGSGAQVPVLMVTSDEDDLLQVELVELGASAFVHKREDVRVLLAWVNNLAMKAKSRKPMEDVEGCCLVEEDRQ